VSLWWSSKFNALIVLNVSTKNVISKYNNALMHTSAVSFSCSFQGFIHIAPAVFQCNTCGRRCNTRSCARKHALLHEGKFPYYCSVCNRGCTSSNQLRGHMSSHTGKKEFSCTCGKEFAYRANWKAHLKKCDQPGPTWMVPFGQCKIRPIIISHMPIITNSYKST
jgi:uncharacterized Zn-finger protein